MWPDLLSGKLDRVCVGGRPPADRQEPNLLLPGSFNPLHRGHREMARIASELIGVPAAYELSLVNVDKPTLGEADIADRLAQFQGDEPVWLTRAPTFLDKARIFPGATFVVGVDTIVRVSDARFYDNNRRRLQSSIGRIVELGCRFLVFGRAWQGRFKTLSQLELDAGLLPICSEVVESDFRHDISSTHIRTGR